MIRIVVYGSNSLIVAGLVKILECQSHLKMVGSFLNEFSPLFLDDCQADLLLLDSSPQMDWEWSQQLQQWMLTTKLKITGILLTDFLTTEEIDEYLQLGFKGFLPRSSDADEIMATINGVMAGLIVIHPELASFNETNSAITPLSPLEISLTSREAEILQLLGTGLDNKAIASTLQISKHTVKFHISSILAKLDVSSRTQAVTFALQKGLIRL
jgi:two-component system, NarL family, response regulator YdfI